MVKGQRAMVLILIGPMGCGKTTIGELLAARLGWPFLDADDFHPAENKAKMRVGIALNDEDRRPWLEILRVRIDDFIKNGESAVLACSALKQAYRDLLGVDQEKVVTIYLKGTFDLISRRLKERRHPYMNDNLLASQLDTLEEPADGLKVDIGQSPEEIVAEILTTLEQNPGPGIVK
ncbi:MAG: gluconokinase [Thermodesulfobacteriota bacterium]